MSVGAEGDQIPAPHAEVGVEDLLLGD
jgi:hypothetical protein